MEISLICSAVTGIEHRDAVPFYLKKMIETKLVVLCAETGIGRFEHITESIIRIYTK